MKQPVATISKLRYAVGMGVTGLVAVVASVLVAQMAGGAGFTLVAVGGVVGLGLVLCGIALLPSAVVKDESWGMAVLLAGGARTFVLLGAMLVLLEVQGLPRKPVVYGVMTGAFIVMMAEAMIAVWLIGARDRARAVGGHGGGVERSVSGSVESPSTSAGHTAGGSSAGSNA